MSSVETMKRECEDAAKQIIILSAKLRDVPERMRLCKWIQNISQLRNDRRDSLKMKHEYLLYLHVTLDSPYKKLTKPFDSYPPELLVPLSECIANRTADYYHDLVPRAGPLQPVMCHKSDDDRAFLCVKRTGDKGILCYMSCAPDANAVSK